MKSIIRITCIILLFWFSYIFASRDQCIYATISGITCFWCFISTISYWLDMLFGNIVYHSFTQINSLSSNISNETVTKPHRSEYYFQSVKDVEVQLKNSLQLRKHKPIIVSSMTKSTYEDGTPIHIEKTEVNTHSTQKEELSEKPKTEFTNGVENNLVILTDNEKFDSNSEKVYAAIVGCLKSLITDKEKLWYLIDSIKHVEIMSGGTIIYTRPIDYRCNDVSLPYEEIIKAIHYHMDDKTHFVSFHELKRKTLTEYYKENIKK